MPNQYTTMEHATAQVGHLVRDHPTWETTTDFSAGVYADLIIDLNATDQEMFLADPSVRSTHIDT